MNWAAIHATAEEIELWSTLTINIAVIGGGISTILAVLRRLPPERIIRIAAISASIFGFIAALGALGWMLFSPTPAWQQCRIPVVKGQTSTDGGAIIIGGVYDEECVIIKGRR